jgi:hypothetical protein
MERTTTDGDVLERSILKKSRQKSVTDNISRRVLLRKRTSKERVSIRHRSKRQYLQSGSEETYASIEEHMIDNWDNNRTLQPTMEETALKGCNKVIDERSRDRSDNGLRSLQRGALVGKYEAATR